MGKRKVTVSRSWTISSVEGHVRMTERGEAIDLEVHSEINDDRAELTLTRDMAKTVADFLVFAATEDLS